MVQITITDHIKKVAKNITEVLYANQLFGLVSLFNGNFYLTLTLPIAGVVVVVEIRDLYLFQGY